MSKTKHNESTLKTTDQVFAKIMKTCLKKKKEITTKITYIITFCI